MKRGELLIPDTPPLYFSEWSTSYTPRNAVHDSYISAPYTGKNQGDGSP